jgi:hypothetical protein
LASHYRSVLCVSVLVQYRLLFQCLFTGCFLLFQLMRRLPFVAGGCPGLGVAPVVCNIFVRSLKKKDSTYVNIVAVHDPNNPTFHFLRNYSTVFTNTTNLLLV